MEPPTPSPPLESNAPGSVNSRFHHPDPDPLMVPRAGTDLVTDLQKVQFLHEHPLIPFTRFASGWCKSCNSGSDVYVNIYGGYGCNELECDGEVLFHKECVKPLQEINHPSHPDHSLKLIFQHSEMSICSFCRKYFQLGYRCSVCDFKLDFACARRPEPLVLRPNPYGHEHPLQLAVQPSFRRNWILCKACNQNVTSGESYYRCCQCEFAIHVGCADLFPEEYHSSHPQHPLKSLKGEVPHYADTKCLLCATNFDAYYHQLHHCDVCNFSICRACMKNPPPVDVECPTTHEHQLRLVPRRINFTCNVCGTQGDQSPYFCLQCNFMIHRQCIGLPRVININRHDHRIAYTRRLGHGEWKCRVCREKVDGFYGAYTCVKCPTLAVHSLCATDKDVWDMVEREGTPEEEEIAPFEVIDDTTIKHFSHDHDLKINKDGHGRILPESTLCVACVLQIWSEPFYSCKQCDFILHEKCAQLPRKKRHVCDNQPFTLRTKANLKVDVCGLCDLEFTGFRYKSGHKIIDTRCGSTSDSLEHESHEHPLYYNHYYYISNRKRCDQCKTITASYVFGCAECDYSLDFECALLPKKVMRKRYDDHPLFLCFGDKNADCKYWCEACETKMDPKKWFYTCNDCGITLHISCVVGDFSYIMPGSATRWDGRLPLRLGGELIRREGEVVSNNSICRPLCYVCNFRCKLPLILKLSKADDVYFCSYKCRGRFRE